MFSKIPSTFKSGKVHYIDINTIHRSLSAPKEINEDLRQDILAKGMLKPLEIQSSKYRNCLLGNQRLLILRDLGIKKVPVIFLTERIERKEKPKKIQKIQSIQSIQGVRFVSGHERVLKKRKKKKINKNLKHNLILNLLIQ